MLARKRSLTLAPAGLLLLVFGNACSTDTPAGEVLTSDRENVLSLQGEGVIRFSLPPGVNEADVQRNYVRAQRLENGRCRFEGTPDTLRLGEAIRIFIIERNLATCEFIFGRAPAGMPTPQTGASDTVVHRFGLPIGRTDVRADAGVTVPGSSQSALVDTTSFRARDIVEVWGAGVTRYPFSAIDVDYTVDGSCVIGGYLQNEVSYNTVRIDHPSGFTGSGYGRWTRQEWQYMQNVPNCLGRPTLHAHWRFQTFSTHTARCYYVTAEATFWHWVEAHGDGSAATFRDAEDELQDAYNLYYDCSGGYYNPSIVRSWTLVG